MQPHLSKSEEWMLRYIGLHHQDGRDCGLQNDKWPPPKESQLSIKNQPATYNEAEVCLTNLAQYQLINTQWNSSGVFLNMTGDGLQCLWELDHPDIVARIGDWARRSPYMAYVILIVLGIGAASAFLTLLWNIATAVWTWLCPR